MNSPPPRSPGGPPNPPPRRQLPTPSTDVNPFMDEPGTGARAQEAPNPFFEAPKRTGGVVTSAPPLVTSQEELSSPVVRAPAQEAPPPFNLGGPSFDEGPSFDQDEAPTPPRGPSPRAAPSPPTRAQEDSSNFFQTAPAAAAAQQGAVPPSGRTPVGLPQGAPLRVQPGAVSPTIGDPHAEFRRGSFKKFAALVALVSACGAGLYFGLPASEPEAKPVDVNTDLRANAVIGASVSPEIIEDPKKSSATSPRAAPAPATDSEDSPSSASSTVSQGNFANTFKSNAK